MGTVLFVQGQKEPVLLKEGYETIKKRVFDGRFFLEATFKDGRKITINKGVIDCFGREKKAEEKEKTEKYKKTVRKEKKT